MSTLPQHATRKPRNPDEPNVVRQMRDNPSKAIDPFLPQYLHQLPDAALLLPTEVGSLFRVDAKTVTRWSKRETNRLPYVRTPGGHLRFRVVDVRNSYDRMSRPDAGR